ncbi:MAG: hypothetical protein ACE5KE_07455 [Methanosarcinales archaeon]
MPLSSLDILSIYPIADSADLFNSDTSFKSKLEISMAYNSLRRSILFIAALILPTILLVPNINCFRIRAWFSENKKAGALCVSLL